MEKSMTTGLRCKPYFASKASRRSLCAVVASLACLQAAAIVRGAETGRVVQASGVQGGLVVHIGCGDGKGTAALRVNERYVVHGLDTDPTNVEKAREHIRSRGLSGKVSVDTFDGQRLPYVDNLANLVVAETLSEIPMAEVLRVLAPLGVAMIGGEKTVKPWPDAIDEWSHYLHGPDNNALADDRVVGPPRHMQWLAEPRWTRHHHADKGSYPAIRAVVSTRGRLYYMADETKSSNRAVPSTWFLVARDGFSGVLLWKKRLEATSFASRLENVWRTIVADGDRVYASLGTDQPLSALNGATGAVIRSYRGTEGLQEVITDGGILFVVSKDSAILALAADSGELLWQWDAREDGGLVLLTLTASGGKVFVKTDKNVQCLSADQGKTLWRVALASPQKKAKLRFPHEKLLVAEGVVLCSYGGKDPQALMRDKYEYLGSHPQVNEYAGKLAALSAEDGRVLWRATYRPGLESTPGEVYVSGGVVWLGPDFAQPRDLRTGTVKKTRPVLEKLWTDGHHYRCYPGKATSRYIITAKRGIEMIDLAGEDHSRNNWVRATCRVGVTPCNGLLYAPPHSCGCYMEARLNGFWALASTTSGATKEPAAPARLQKGPAYGKSDLTDSNLRDPDWSTYRGDAARSGSTGSSVPADVKQLWKADLGGRLSAVTVADGRALVAQVDTHTVTALDAGSGKVLWRFTAGGRVDSPPTIYRGLVLFGSKDGWVYCLRASDGGLVWRFLAAQQATHAVAYEQVESLWPVHGSVLVEGGIAYAAAGRSSHLDGGIALWGLDPETGSVRCTTRVVSEHVGALAPPTASQQSKMSEKISQNKTDYKTFLAADRSDSFSMRGSLTDVLVADGGAIFMRQARFDGKLMPQDEKRPHLFSTASLLDGSEHHRLFWLLGTGDFARLGVAFPWLINNKKRKAVAVPYGMMLTFDDKTVWGAQRSGEKGVQTAYTVYATPRPDPGAKTSLLGDFAARSSKQKAVGESWRMALPMRPRAMVRAKDALFIGGQTAARGKGGLLHVVSCKNGRTLGAAKLDSPPVWDGMSAAGGRLFIPLEDGSVVCLSGKPTP